MNIVRLICWNVRKFILCDFIISDSFFLNRSRIYSANFRNFVHLLNFRFANCSFILEQNAQLSNIFVRLKKLVFPRKKLPTAELFLFLAE